MSRLTQIKQAVTKRAGRKKDNSNAQATGGRGGEPQVRKAVFESTKKKEVGVSDLTLISKITNEAINDNLKKRFENGEIYVRRAKAWGRCRVGVIADGSADIHWPCVGLGQSVQRS